MCCGAGLLAGAADTAVLAIAGDRHGATDRESIRDLCRGFGSDYWQRMEVDATYPEAFVRALTEAGWLSVLIPTEFGGGGLGVTEASVILEEINRSGANSGACHAQMLACA